MPPQASPPAGWPAGKSLALSVSVMLEGWSDDSAPGLGPMGNPLRAGVLDLQARSWAEYWPKAGAWRPLYVRYGAEPEAFTRIFERIVGNWPRVGRSAGCLDITVHAHVFGRPFGAIEFLNCLEAARRYEEWAFLTDHRSLAALCKAG